MDNDSPIWKILTLVLTVVTIAVSIFVPIFIHNDSKKDAEHKIVEILSLRYAFVDQEMTYGEALEAVDREFIKMENELSGTQDSLDEKNSEIESLNGDVKDLNSTIALKDTEIAQLKAKIDYDGKIALAESYASNGNYEVAIPILNEIKDKGKDVSALLTVYTATFETNIISKAEQLIEENKYDEAIAVVDDALIVLPNSQSLKDEKSNCTPKYLTDTIVCYRAENLWKLGDREEIQMSGKTYKHAIYSAQSDSVADMLNMSYSAFAYYNLDGKYKQLSGTIGHVDYSGSGTIGMNDAGQVYNATVSIWGDNDTKLYSRTLSASANAEPFSISVEGVDTLEFTIECSGNSRVGVGEIVIR